MVEKRDYDIALSFAGEERNYVDRVANLLKERGVKVFYDLFEEADLWGKDLYVHLSEVYQKRARFTVMFISEAYAKKLWTNHERKSAQARAFQEAQEYILPARFDDTEIPGVSATVGYVSLETRSPEDLVSLITKKLASSGESVPTEPNVILIEDQWQAERHILETRALKANGETGIVSFNDGSNIGTLDIATDDATYTIVVALDAPDIGRSVRVWDHDETIHSVSIVRGVSQGKYIDVNVVNHAREFIVMFIGSRAFTLTKDASIIQLVLVEVRDRNAGDAVDVVRFRYKVHERGAHMLEAL